MNENDKQPDPGNGGSPWMKNMLIWVGLFAALALFVTLFDSSSRQSAANAIPYSTFLDRVDDGSVRDVNVSSTIITGTLKDDSKFRTYSMQDPNLTQHLRDHKVTITARPDEGPNFWLLLLYQ